MRFESLKWRWLFAAIAAVLISVGARPCLVAAAQDKMPPTAPPIRQAADQEPGWQRPGSAPNLTAQEAAQDGSGAPRTTVNVHAGAKPLSAAVSRTATAGGALQGSADYMTRTPPVLGASASKRVIEPEMFRAWLHKAHPEFTLSATGDGAEVLEVKGAWDDSGRTLRKLGIPYTHIRAGQLDDYPLERVKVLVVNCAGKVPRAALQRIRDFVSRGGFLLTTDWGLDNLVQKAFPGYVAWDKKMNRHDMYDAEVVDPDSVLFRNAVSNSFWKLDEDCHLLMVIKPDAVRVLVRSRGLAGEDGQGILAVTFPFGRGQVLHLVGHFDNNAAFAFTNVLPDPAPGIGISLRQAIASNFVVAGLRGQHVPELAERH